MNKIWERLTERNTAEWRRAYKALLLLDYMLRNGSSQVITDARAHTSILQGLRDSYSAFENGEDKGISSRFSPPLLPHPLWVRP